jgi:glycosyltransferase involved in cell wall biosynthesis
LSAENIVVKPNFVHPDPGPVKSGREHAVFVGRLAPKERVSTILKAWARIGNRIPLLIIGGGIDRSQLEQEASLRGLANVRFLGQLTRDQVLAEIRKAHFLLFSSEWYENFPMTIAESFACGVPVICSRLGAMEEIVEDKRTGLHFTPGDPEDLAEKVCWALDHPTRMESMGKEARQEYETKYTAEKNYPILMNVYRRAIANA